MSNFQICDGTHIWRRENSLPAVQTFCQSLDEVLGSHGAKLGSVTELLGLPGSGKTQLCLQLCASVQIPKELGGLDAEALFIDTNKNFTLTRFREILRASLKKCEEVLQEPLQRSEDESLERLHYVSAFGLERYCTLLYSLPNFIKKHPKIKLIVIDSIAFPFKDGLTTIQRTGVLFRHLADLQKLAVKHQIAVVVSNGMSTRVGLNGGTLVGALGDAWSHRCNVRMLLSGPNGDSNHRFALVLKSNMADTDVGSFQITKDGIRDVDD